MFNSFCEMLAQPFMIRALVVGGLISVVSAVLGVVLVLKQYSMIGDGLSHVSFSVFAISSALNWAHVALSVPVVMLFAIFLLRFSEKLKIKGDAAIALISTSSLAVGVVVVSVVKGINANVMSYMFGSILAITRFDLIFSLVFSFFVLILFLVLYNRIFYLTFDSEFAKATGLKTKAYDFLIAIVTAVTIVIGMKMVGALLMSGLIVFPALSSMRLVNSFKFVVLCSVLFSFFCFLFGLIFAYVFSMPPGATVVVFNLVNFIFCSFLGFIFCRFKLR